MKLKHVFTTALATALLSCPAFAQNTATVDDVTRGEELVITAARIETPVKQVASTLTVLTGQELENTHQMMLAEPLKTTPGIQVVRTGPIGQTTDFYIRGAKTAQSLVMIDGIEMNDPMSIGRGFDFANLMITDIDRVEIIRGANSPLYGSDAMGGVINIITKKGEPGTHAYLSAEAGSNNTFFEKVGVSGSEGMVNFLFSGARLDTDGISAAGKKYGNTEKDGYYNTTVATKIGVTPNEMLNFDFFVRYVDDKADVDNFGGAFGDDPNHTVESERYFTRAKADVSLFDGVWEQTLGVSFTDQTRKDINPVDASHPTDWAKSRFDGRMLKFDWQNNVKLTETNTLTLGVETEEEKGKNDDASYSGMYGPSSSKLDWKKVRTNSFYAQDFWRIEDSFFIAAGLRYDDHDEFGGETTFRIAPAYVINSTGTKIKGTYATGFKAPSIYQLYSSYGNENLKEETSKSWDIGLEQEFMENSTAGITYFHNEFEDMIDYDYSTYTYNNIAKATTKGVEVYVTFKPTDSLTIKPNYTYLDAKDDSTGDDLLRRAKHTFGFYADWAFCSKGNINLTVVYVGKRDDLDFNTYPSTKVELKDYTLVNIAATYNVSENLQFYGRIDNILDEEYEEVVGYGTLGAAGYFGLKLSI